MTDSHNNEPKPITTRQIAIITSAILAFGFAAICGAYAISSWCYNNGRPITNIPAAPLVVLFVFGVIGWIKKANAEK